MTRLTNFINGAYTLPAGGGWIDNESPLTGEKIGEVARSTAEDVNAAVGAATAASAAWREKRPIERGRILLAIAAKLRERMEEFVALECAETGKPPLYAPMEMAVAADYFEFYGGLVNAIHGEAIDLGAHYHSYTRREPFGVVGIILPWNGPLNQAGRAVAPALAAGNTVVVKPSEFTSATALKLAEIAVEECGLPKGVLNVVTGLGKEAGEALVSHKAVRKVAFTGSVRAGREVAQIAAERIIPATLELGGKSPNIVFADANLAEAVPGSVRAFVINAGQVCLAGTRCLVERSIHNEFVEGLAKALDQVPVGSDQNALIGPMTTRAQYEKVQHYYRIAAEDGAKPVIGGALPERNDLKDGWFVSPTIYTDVTNDMRIAREEVFGPVAAVIPFDDEEDAIRIANDTDYGLAAGIWTQNLSRAHRVAARLEAGQIYVNEYMAGGVETPLGGYKQSGYGREKGLEALHHYTQLKCVTIKL